MIDYSKKELENGLKVIIHKDETTPIVAVNLAYDVGARDEDPSLTGLAHYFEHLMFSGSKNAPNYDEIVQNAGGQNNAFTTNDYTNYYITLPKNNLEVALWLEADRMHSLNLTEKNLEVQRGVVIEEFKQRYLNQPYGNNFADLRKLVYKRHPYSWSTIGKEIGHIEKVTMNDAQDFYNRFYAPNNCILTICGDVNEEDTFQAVKKYFGSIPSSNIQRRERPVEPKQREYITKVQEEEVPLDALMIAFKIPGRTDENYYKADLLSDILGRDESSVLQQSLVHGKKLVNNISCYCTGERDPGMLVISTKIKPQFSIDEVEKEIWAILNELKARPIDDFELSKVKNKYETAHVYGELNVMNKATNLAYAELLGDVDFINQELEAFKQITSKEVKSFCEAYINKNQASVLKIKRKN